MLRLKTAWRAVVLGALALAVMGAETQCQGPPPETRPSVAGLEARITKLESRVDGVETTVGGLGDAVWFAPGNDIVAIETEFPIFTTVEEFELDPGSYVVTARADLRVRSERANDMTMNPAALCALTEGGQTRDSATVQAHSEGQVFANEIRVPITLTAGVIIGDPEAERIGIRCWRSIEFGIVDARKAALVAIAMPDLVQVAP